MSERRFVVDTNVLVSRLLQRVARRVVVLHRVTACHDPRDDKLFDVALNGEAECIVGGDKDLLALDPFRGRGS